MSRPVHFEIPAQDPEKLIGFYETVFGWKAQKWDGPMPYWMITTGGNEEPGINGGIMPQQYPNQPCVNTVSVSNLDQSIATVTSAGGQIALPKMAVPGVGWLAYCTDPEGHVFGMMQPETSAK